MYVEASGSSVIASGAGAASMPLPGDPSCWVGSINVVDMAKRKYLSIVCCPKVYVSCTVISYDYIDSKHNMIEIHGEIRKLPDEGKSS